MIVRQGEAAKRIFGGRSIARANGVQTTVPSLTNCETGYDGQFGLFIQRNPSAAQLQSG